MLNKILIVVLLSLSFAHMTYQSRYNYKVEEHKQEEKAKEKPPVIQNENGSHAKSALIIAGGIILLIIVIYGTKCFYVIKMHFFEKKEKMYTKMDLTSNV